MTDVGFFIIPRCILEEPVLQNDAYFRAWFWLVSAAAWKPRCVRVTNGRAVEVVELERGQLSHSRGYMAKAWGWSEKRVRTFLSRLENRGMIDIHAGRHQTVLTIRNYDIYQPASTKEGPQTGRQRAGKGPEEEYIQEGKNRNSALKTAKNPRGWPDDGFGRWYALYPRKRGRGAAQKAFAEACESGLISFDELLAATKRFVEWAIDKNPQYIKFPANWLDSQSYLDEPDKPTGAASNARIAEPSLDPQSFNDADWKDRLRNNWDKGEWSSLWGPRPGEAGCKVPAHLLNGGSHG